MLWSWDGTSFYGTGSSAPDAVSGNKQQQGTILRTITGRGSLVLVWSKEEMSFTWNQAPEAVGTYLRAMTAYNSTIAFTDSVIGTYSFMLTDDALQVGEAVDGLVSASALFREV